MDHYSVQQIAEFNHVPKPLSEFSPNCKKHQCNYWYQMRMNNLVISTVMNMIDWERFCGLVSIAEEFPL